MNKPPLIAVTLLLSLLLNVLLYFYSKQNTEEVRDCRDLAIDQALENAYVDRVLDSVANARADSIVEYRMYLLSPE